MANWYTKSLGDGMVAWEPLAQLEAAFAKHYPQADTPDDAAVFSRHSSDGQLHCSVTVFFSPATAALAQAVDARACARPSRRGLQLLVGPKGALELLLPDD